MKKAKFTKFAKILKEHIKDEASIHKNLIARKRTFKQHYQDTLKIHKKAYKKLKKLLHE